MDGEATVLEGWQLAGRQGLYNQRNAVRVMGEEVFVFGLAVLDVILDAERNVLFQHYYQVLLFKAASPAQKVNNAQQTIK